MSRTIHVALSVDVDRFNDRYLVRHYNGVLRMEGRYVQVPHELRKLCAEFKARGYVVFPACDDARPDGTCPGHETPERAGAEGGE